VKAVILAAGEGTRLRPLTENIPKPMLPVAGKPLLEWMIDRVKEADIKDILIVTNYLEEQIKDYFIDGSNHEVNISYRTQEKTLGTANAFYQAYEWVGKNSFVALYGDHYLSEGTLKKIKKTHREGEATIAALKVNDPSQYGAFKIEEDRIIKVVEKPPKGKEPSNFANVGIYIFPPEVFWHIEETPKSPRGEYEITDTMQRMINSGLTHRKFELQESDWLDIGLPWKLLEANEKAMKNLETKIEGTVEEWAQLHGPVWVKNGARVRSGAYIEGPAIIDEKSDVGPNCYIRSCTYLGKNTRIGNACEIKNSIIMDGTHAAHLSYVGDSIIGKNCNLGAGTITANTRFDRSPIEVTVKGERLNSGRRKLGIIMGECAQTGINVCFHPGVIVGSGAWIAPGVTIQRDVKSNVIRYFFSKLEERDR
jgi:bifunctional UDP-N-acetylglucosamine pyrophosphorylase/glucosamine-1-phosphate N-acetyltransferase